MGLLVGFRDTRNVGLTVAGLLLVGLLVKVVGFLDTTVGGTEFDVGANDDPMIGFDVS